MAKKKKDKKGIATPKPQNRMNVMTQCVKRKAHVAGEYTSKAEKADEGNEVGRAKYRSLNFILNMMESHHKILSSEERDQFKFLKIILVLLNGD